MSSILILVVIIVIALIGFVGTSNSSPDPQTLCTRCGKAITSFTRVEGGVVCPDCLAQYYGRCEECGDYVDLEELRLNDGVCEICMQNLWDEMEAGS